MRGCGHTRVAASLVQRRDANPAPCRDSASRCEHCLCRTVTDPLLPDFDADRLECLLATAAREAAALWLARRRPGLTKPDARPTLPDLRDLPLPIEALPAELAAMLASAAPYGADPLNLAHIPSIGNAAALIADWFAAAANLHTASALLSPQGVALERDVIATLADFLGYGRPCGGLLTSGSSLANLTALTAARDAALPGAGKEGLTGLPPGRLYASTAVHACIPRAARVLGLGQNALVTASSVDPERIDPELLRKHLRADRAAGLRPVAVIATIGTAATGAIDPLAELADVSRAEEVWLHVDAAYGAPAAAIEPELARAMAAADSVALDLHKWLFLPYETGCLLVRDARALAASFSFRADYLDLPHDELDPMQLGPELSRGLRALRIWASFRCIGTERLREALRHCLGLARSLCESLGKAGPLEVCAPVELSVVCLRLRGSERLDGALADCMHRELLGCLASTSPPIQVSTLRRGGRLVLRICFVNPATRADQVTYLVERLEACARDVNSVTGD